MWVVISSKALRLGAGYVWLGSFALGRRFFNQRKMLSTTPFCLSYPARGPTGAFCVVWVQLPILSWLF